MKIKIIFGVLGFSVLTLGSYFSPHWNLHQMKVAIEDHDADSFSEHVDFPALRDNIKGQMMVIMDKQMSTSEMRKNPMVNFGQAMALALINPMIDASITPTGVIRMMRNGTTQPIKQGGNTAYPASLQEQSAAPEYSISYRGWSKVVVSKVGEDSGSFIFKRAGLWTWKLSAVDLPKEIFKKNDAE